MARKLLKALATVAAVSVVAGGCGGGDGTDSSAPVNGGGEKNIGSSNGGSEGEARGGNAEGVTTSSLDREEFIRQASARCHQAKKGLLQKAAKYVKEHSSEEVPEAVLTANGVSEVVMPVVEAQIEAVRQLGAPAGDEDEIEAMLSAQEDAVETVREQERLDPVKGPAEFFEDSNKAYEEYGLRACGYNL